MSQDQPPQPPYSQQGDGQPSSPQWGREPPTPWNEQAPPQYQPQYTPQQQWPPQQTPQKKRGVGKFFAIGCGALAVLLILIITIAVATSSGSSSTATTSQVTQPAQQPTVQPTLAPTPTPKPAPTQSPAQLEQAYKASATSTTVATLDKDGNNDQGNIVHFTCTIFGFVKDSSGNTAGANVDDPNTSGVIQVGFPAGTDLSQLNTGDSLEVWGVDGGTASGQNAFGATVQEVVVAAQYMTDQTTGYSTS